MKGWQGLLRRVAGRRRLSAINDLLSRFGALTAGSTSVLALTTGLALTTVSTAGAAGLLLEGATVHSLAAEPGVASVLIVDGLIQAVGADLEVASDVQRLDVHGLHVYPGFFDALSQVGLVEINGVAATVDTSEIGRFNPHLTALTAVHPASEVIPVTRANGLSHALTVPSTDDDGMFAGQGAVIHLAGWTVEEMAVEPSAAMVVEWPAIQTRSFDFATFSVRETPFNEAKKTAEKAQAELRDWIDAARHYAQGRAAGSQRVQRDLRLEAMAKILDGQLPVIIRANAKRDIEAAVAFAEEEGLRMILAGGEDAWKVKELLAEKRIPVILGLVQSLPKEEDDAYDQPYRLPGVLHQAGVQIAFGSSAGGGFGPGGPHIARTLPFEAAAAIPYGLPADAALAALTRNPAEMLGLGDRLGTVEAGKVANLMITDGDPLEMTTQVVHMIINGQQVTTDNKHLREYERYRARP